MGQWDYLGNTKVNNVNNNQKERITKCLNIIIRLENGLGSKFLFRLKFDSITTSYEGSTKRMFLY